MSRTLWQSATHNLPDLWLNHEFTPKTEQQLIEFSNTDPDVLANTHDGVRFHDAAAVHEWLNKDRQLFILETETGDLQGLMWVSQKQLSLNDSENYDLTLAIRLYGQARGKGLAIPFLQTVLTQFKTSGKKFWLKTKASNVKAVESYKTVGFQQQSAPDTAGDIIMVLS